ncbi:GGDEF domain-containing protein [Shewanella sp. NIFS-20-20]|uniref:GGDEF domain-containing protein n=1 Tax=Shewanella sp. NIFS-20-20 TaxID=2853806 RepID=UPI001C46B730|nr:GGDEF domain-containing protein [Shewanella sp. NIFS-20-20]MBV7316357.1 GGDEF domain-containing protein [Shewanella sp. NIFS-20-20]
MDKIITAKTDATGVDPSTKLLRLAIPQMTRYGIAVTPDNYAVWYEYFKGENRSLVTAVNHYINNEIRFTDKINQDLYHQFVEAKPTVDLVKSHLDTERIISNLLDTIASMSTDSCEFSGVLTTYSHRLNTSPTIDSLGQLVTELKAHVDEMITSNSSLEQSLGAMQTELSCLKSEMSTLEQASLTDALTSLKNRRAFDMTISAQVDFVKQGGEPFCLLMIDIDHFKKINDIHGHQVGDKVLAYVAKMLTNAVRGEDFVGRFGGEEFVIILPKTDYTSALVVAENLRSRISHKQLSIGKAKESIGKVTVSIGVATANIADDNDSCIARADAALYSAKAAGRNSVVGEQRQ